jgi:hypothetical protein
MEWSGITLVVPEQQKNDDERAPSLSTEEQSQRW